MHIPSSTIYDIFSKRSVTEIYHANSVVTACHFLKENALLSRGTVERIGYRQSPQKSDPIDKKKSIWFDVFADSVDIHQRASTANSYGPVTFVIDTEIILNTYTGRIWVTKRNPTKWDGLKEADRWFQNKDDLDKNFVRGEFDQMLVFRHCGGALPFKSYLKKIILDDPKIEGYEIDFYSLAYGALALAMLYGRIDVPIERRKCKDSCKCHGIYKSNHELVYKMYYPDVQSN